MNKMKWFKLLLVVIFIIIAGIFYSCNNKDKVAFISKNEDDSSIEEITGTNYDDNTVTYDNTKDSGDTIVGEKTEENAKAITIPSGNLEAINSTTDEISNTENSSKYIYVHICGEVQKPDVYKVQADTRVYELIAKAGGLTDAAADAYINQASIVTDGQQIYIPSFDEVEDVLPGISNISTNETIENSNKNSGTININIATADELMTLSGVGQAKAQAIIDYRMSNGDFQSIDDIKKIAGIKDAVYNKIKDKISVK